MGYLRVLYFIKCGPHLFGVGRELIIPGALLNMKYRCDDNFDSQFGIKHMGHPHPNENHTSLIPALYSFSPQPLAGW